MKHISTRLFNRIMLNFFMLMFLSIMVLTTITTYSISSALKEQEIQNNRNIMGSIDQALISRQQDLKQTLKNIYMSTSTNPGVFHLLSSRQIDEITPEYMKYHHDVSDFLGQMARLYNSNLRSVYVFDIDISRYYAASNVSTRLTADECSGDIGAAIQQMMQAAERGGPPACYSQNITVTDTSGNKADLFITYSKLMDNHNYIQPVGYLAFVYDTASLRAVDSRINQNEMGHFYVFTTGGELIFDSDDGETQYAGTIVKSIRGKDGVPDGEITTEYGSRAIVNLLWDKTLGICVAGVLPYSQLYSGINRINGIILLFAAVCLAVCFAVTYKRTTTYSKRTRMLIRSIEAVKGGATGAITAPSGIDEISSIHASFNEMCTKLNQYIQEVYVVGMKEKQAELREKSAQLYALQMQINPHFLYNTLEVIRMNCLLLGEDRKVAKMIRMLSQIFRSTVNTDMIVPLREEFKLCQAYLQIFQLRYPDNLKVTFDIDPRTEPYGIIKYILVPIVENSLVHGMDFNKENCINVSARLTDGNIVLAISDNGKGIEAAALAKMNADLASNSLQDLGIGLSNVQRRIHMIYNARGKLNIESRLGYGVRVTVTIPAIPMEELSVLVQSFAG